MPLGRRVILARVGHQRLVLSAAAVTITLAATLLTALWVYAGAASTVSARNALAADSSADTGVVVSTGADTLDVVDAADEIVRAEVDQAFEAVPHDVTSRLRTTSTYTLPERAGGEGAEELTVFAWFSDLEQHATLVAGAWPAPATSGEPVQVALLGAAADVLGVGPGSTMTVVQRLDQLPVEVVVSGTYDVVDPGDWYWRSDPLTTTGVQSGADFTTRGPLVVGDRATLDTAVEKRGMGADWVVGPRWTELDGGAVDETTRGVRTLVDAFVDLDLEGVAVVRVQTELDEILPSVQRALVANRSMMVIPVLQLALLAAYTLLLAARLLLEHRRAELALLRARGTSTGQIVRLTLIEAVGLVLPGALLAPLVALLLLRGVEGRSPFVELGAAIGSPALSWWGVAVGAALMCCLALVVPTLRREKTYVDSQAERGRQARRTVVQRAGGDFILLGGAGIAYWQLRHYRLPVIEQAGAVTIDPLLVLGPSLVLFAAGLVALRALPWVARLVQTFAVARPSLGGALGAWQVARRPLRYAGPALLLVFALAIGAMSTAYGASWEQSQRDQATFQAGADVRVAAPGTVEVVPVAGQAAALATAPGVEEVVPVWRSTTRLGDTIVGVLAIDALRAAEVVRMRPDLGPPVDQLLAPLAADRPDPVTIVLPGRPTTVRLQATTALEPVAPVRAPLPRAAGTVALVLADASGVLISTPPVDVEVDGGTSELSFDLSGLARGDSGVDAAALSYPLTLVGAEVNAPIVSAVENVEDPDVITSEEIIALRATIDLGGLEVDGAAVEVPPGFGLAATTRFDPRGGTGVVAAGPLAGAFLQVRVTAEPSTGTGTARVRLASGTRVPEVPLVLDRTAAAAAGTAPGQRVTMTINGLEVDGLVRDVIEAFPGTDPTTGVVVADLQSLQQDRLAGSGAPLEPTEWWMSSSDTAATSAALAAEPRLAPDLVSSTTVASALRASGATTLGALLAGFAAALAFAAVGFTVNLVIGSRERLSEFAVLRALGLSRRQVVGMLLVEQAFLVGLGLAIGLAIGVGVSALVVPLVVISPTAGATVPVVLLSVPWGVLASTAIGAALLLGAIVVVAANRLQRSGLGSALRLGEEA